MGCQGGKENTGVADPSDDAGGVVPSRYGSEGSHVSLETIEGMQKIRIRRDERGDTGCLIQKNIIKRVGNEGAAAQAGLCEKHHGLVIVRVNREDVTSDSIEGALEPTRVPLMTFTIFLKELDWQEARKMALKQKQVAKAQRPGSKQNATRVWTRL